MRVEGAVQGRSGRVALLRTKLVVAMAARGVERARRPARRAGVERRRAEAILKLLMLAMNQLIEFEVEN